MSGNAEIFVLDPNKTDRENLIKKIKEPGYSVIGLQKAKELLTHLEQDAVQFVILDLGIQDMNAFDLIDRIKLKYPDVKIITITSNASSAMRKKIAKIGVLFHSTKPKHLYQLKQIIKVTMEFHVRKTQKLVL